MINLRSVAVGMAAAVLGLVPVAVVAGPAGASTPALTGVGLSQTRAVNASQTTYPITIHWKNTGGAAAIDIYRYNPGNPATLIGRVDGSINRFVDHLRVSGSEYAFSDPIDGTRYLLTAEDANGNSLGDSYSPAFIAYALDDAANLFTFDSGAWSPQNNATGATENHYSYSSSPGATATLAGACWYDIGLVATTGPSGGTANVVVNGSIVKKVSFYSSAVKNRVLLWKAAASTSQCSTVQVVQTSGRINVDTFQMLTDRPYPDVVCFYC